MSSLRRRHKKRNKCEHMDDDGKRITTTIKGCRRVKHAVFNRIVRIFKILDCLLFVINVHIISHLVCLNATWLVQKPINIKYRLLITKIQPHYWRPSSNLFSKTIFLLKIQTLDPEKICVIFVIIFSVYVFPTSCFTTASKHPNKS